MGVQEVRLASTIGTVRLTVRLRAITERLPYFRSHLLSTHPEFEADSTAKLDVAFGAPTADLNEVRHSPTVYSEADDQALRRWVRERVGTTWHSMNTCPMNAREEYGVVDAHLNVYGIRGVKVAGRRIAHKLSQTLISRLVHLPEEPGNEHHVCRSGHRGKVCSDHCGRMARRRDKEVVGTLLEYASNQRVDRQPIWWGRLASAPYVCSLLVQNVSEGAAR